MSSEVLTFIVQALNQPPFNCNTTLISFDSWSPSKLLQQFSDVISWITQTDNIDITRESADETAIRLLHHLKILKFRPPTDIGELEEWRAGLVEGAKRSIYPVLFYIFSNVDMLKQRAYLAKYLVKVEIPSGIHDAETAQLQNELGQLMERFKESHAQVVEVQQDSLIVDEIKADLKSMEVEKDALIRKIEKAHRKVQNMPGLEKYMASAENLRKERERLADMNIQKTEQRKGVILAEKKLQRLKEQLKEIQQAGENIDPTNLLAQLEDEISTSKYLVQTKLSKEIEHKRQIVGELTKISYLPAIDQNDIKKLQQEIAARTDRIMALEEERDKNEEGLDENFSIFRHQAATVERRKNGIAQKLQEARQELTRLEAQVEEKKEILRSTTGADVMSVNQFKQFVAAIRSKKVEYKKKKSTIEEYLTERELMMRTIDLLSKKFESLKDKIESMGGEVEEAIPIPLIARPMTAAPQFNNIEELRYMIKELMEKLDKKRDEIEPLKRKREEKQKEFNKQDDIVRNRKNEYDRRKMQLESGYAELKKLVTELEERYVAATTDVDALENNIKEATEDRDRLQKEEEGESVNNELQISIHAAEEEAKNLLRLCEARDGSDTIQQVAMWRGLLTMFEAKLSDHRETDRSELSGK